MTLVVAPEFPFTALAFIIIYPTLELVSYFNDLRQDWKNGQLKTFSNQGVRARILQNPCKN